MKQVLRRVKQCRAGLFLSLVTMLCSSSGVYAGINILTDTTNSSPKARTVIEITAKGDTITRYIYDVFDFREIYNANSIRNQRTQGRESKGSATVNPDLSLPGDINIVRPPVFPTADVGEISYTQSVSSTGGKTIAIPIQTGKVPSLFPTLALCYNSQSGNMEAGYGWSLSGLSSITLTNKNQIFDRETSPSDLSKPEDCVFALDGIRILRIQEGEYETAQGFISVKKVMVGNHISHFEVKYPNGNIATFGYKNNTTTQITYPVTSMTDMRGYRMEFEYEKQYNSYYIKKISYGSRSTLHPAEISFEYSDRNDYVTTYSYGESVSLCRILKSIVSTIDNQELRTYKLSYSNLNATGINRLIKLECSAGSSILGPLTFSYGEAHGKEESALVDNCYGAMAEYFSGNLTTKL